MTNKSIASYVEEKLASFLPANGLELYDQEFVKEGRRHVLRIFIDRIQTAGQEEEYVSTEDCEKVSRYLSESLDRDDPVEGAYSLEVSSPGMDRELRKEAHFTRYMGSEVEVRLYSPREASRTWQGRLSSYGRSGLEITLPDGRVMRFDAGEVAKVSLAVAF